MNPRRRSNASRVGIEPSASSKRRRSTASALAATAGNGGTSERLGSTLPVPRRSNDRAATLASANPIFRGSPGLEDSFTRDLASTISTNPRRRSTVAALTDHELQQVLGDNSLGAAHTTGASSKRRFSSTNTGGIIAGSDMSPGPKVETSDCDLRFIEHVQDQPRATYVPIAFAEKILEKVAKDAEETRSRHQDVVVSLEATYREIDEKTKRHYSELILRLQGEMRTELRQWAKQKKEQEELVENLRDKIASQTAAAAALALQHAEERDGHRLARERDAKDFSDRAANLVQEKQEALAAAALDAAWALAETEATSVDNNRRRSMQRVELEDKAIRAMVSLSLQSVVSAVEQREEQQGRAVLTAGLAASSSEVALLRAELAEASTAIQPLRAEVLRLGEERNTLQEEGIGLKAKLEEMLKAQATEDREPVIEVDTGKLSLYALEEAKTTKRGQQAGDSPPGEAEDAEASRVTEIPKTQVPEDQQPDNDVENEEISLYALEGAETIKSEQQAGDSSPQEAEDAEALREGQERAQAAAMEEEETRFMVFFELVRGRREAGEAGAKATALSKLLEKERAISRREREATAAARRSSAAGQNGEEKQVLDQSPEVEDAEIAVKQAEAEVAEEEAAARETERILEAAVEESKAKGDLMKRVAELEASNASLKEEILNAQQQASIAAAAAAAVGTEAIQMIQTNGYGERDADTREDNSARKLSASAAVAGETSSTTIEKGPSPDDLKVEELRAELQTATADKKKVKAEIKGWVKEFEIREGTPPSNEDKTAIRDTFVAHKRLERLVTRLSSELQALEAEIASKKESPVVAAEARTEPSTPADPAAAPGFWREGRDASMTSDSTGLGLLKALREENATLRDKLAVAMAGERKEGGDRGGGRGDGDPEGLGPVSTAWVDEEKQKPEVPKMARKLKEAMAAVAVGQSTVALLTKRLQESETKKKLLKTALGQLNDTTTKMLANAPQNSASGEVSSAPAAAGESGDTRADELTQGLLRLQEAHATAEEEARARQQALEETLRGAQEEARDIALASKKSEHLRQQAEADLEAARAELASCQLVVDESSEAARLREQVTALKIDLDTKSRAATAGWDAAAGAESEAQAAEARGLQAGIKRGRAEAEKKVQTLKNALAAAKSASEASRLITAAEAGMAVAVASENRERANPVAGDAVSSQDRVTTGGDGAEAEAEAEAAVRAAKELAAAQRELENVREREKDARDEANRTAEELERFRAKQDQQREREANLSSAVSSLEDEKAALSRSLISAQERAALAMELVGAHIEEAARARQESALNAAKFRRVSRDLGPGVAAAAVAAAVAGAEMASPERVPAGRPQTASSTRRTAEQLRLSAATLVHAVKEGTDLWKRERREECHALYAKAGERALGQMPPGQAKDDLRVAMAAAKGLGPAKAAVALRKAFDTVIEAAMVAKENLAQQRNTAREVGKGSGSSRISRPASTGGIGITGRGRSGRSSPNSRSTASIVSASASSEKLPPASKVDSSDGEDLARGSGDNSKVASLQRQLEALVARQTEADQATAAVVAASTGDDGGEDDGDAKRSMLEVANRRCAELEDKVEDLEAECRSLREAQDEELPTGIVSSADSHGSDVGGGTEPGSNNDVSDRGSAAGGRSVSPARARADQQRIRSLEKKNKEDSAKARKLEAQVTKLEAKLAAAVAAKAAAGDSGAAKAKADVKALESKMKKTADEYDRKQQKLAKELDSASKGWESCKADLAQARKERDALRQQISAMGTMGEELEGLRARAEEAKEVQAQLEAANEENVRLEELYHAEQVLRKKYWNAMEDMKGKIRVFARCRPFAQYELNQDCKRAVRQVDESTLEVDGHHGAKQFLFDSVFSEDNTQEDIFEDTKNLVQSALDGFNVCVFAYGQTGSGKTWTMTGGKGELRGLTPRVIEEIFANIDKTKGSIEVKVSCYFIELYLDQLRDLLFAMDHPNDAPPKLEVHLDANKMVVVKNVVIKSVAQANDLTNVFTQGNRQRKVGGTKMNAESSRSHSVFSILLEVYNRTTKKSTTGKISLVDLAGSERADKTGATADRLKEAQSINKSLSALGDVISALSKNEKFVPYRNNKLTQVMQDSLGGNAKTLMFVNVSPADYNQEETVTALTYATRVKLITNSAEKQQDGEEVSRLKEIIRRLQAGEEDPDGEGAAAAAAAAYND